MIFGDEDEIGVFMKDIHMDEKTHELVIDQHGNDKLTRIATELHKPHGVDHIEVVPTRGQSGGTSGTESV